MYSSPSQVYRLTWSLEGLKMSMKWDEETFGREYDLDVLRVGCVSDFNPGAMENKGLLIFNCDLLLADAKSTTGANGGMPPTVLSLFTYIYIDII